MVNIPFFDTPDAASAEPSPTPAAPATDPAAAEAAHVAAQDEAKQADIAFRQAQDTILRSGPEPFLSLTGDKAAALAGPTSRELGETFRQVADGLSPPAREKFHAAAGPQLQAAQRDIVDHAQRQQAEAVAAVSLTRQQMAAGEFARCASSDPARAAANLHAAASEAATRAERQDPSPEAVEQAMRQARSEAVVGAVRGELVQDPHAALGLFDSHRHLIEPQAAAALHPLVREEADRVTRSRRIDELVAAARPSLPDGLADLMPPDLHPPLDGEAIAARAVEDAGPDPARQRAAALDARARVAQLNARRTAACRAATAKGQACMADPSIGALADLPAALRLSLPAATRRGLESFYAAGGHPPVSDPQAYGDLHTRLVADPTGFNEADLTPYAALLDKADFARLRSDQETLRQGGPAAQAIRRDVGQIVGKVTGLMAEAGITAAAAPAHLAQVTAAALSEARAAREAQDGKPLSDEQAAAVVDPAVIQAARSETPVNVYAGPTTPTRHGMMDGARYFLPTEDGRDNVGVGGQMQDHRPADSAFPDWNPLAQRPQPDWQPKVRTWDDIVGGRSAAELLHDLSPPPAFVESVPPMPGQPQITPDQLHKAVPGSGDLVTTLVPSINKAMAGHGIVNRYQAAAFLAQAGVETQNFTRLEETLDYTHAQRVLEVFKGRVKTLAEAKLLLRNPRGIANLTYGGKNGNRPNTEDGHTYRGRGLLHLTGRGNYRLIGHEEDPDAVSQPDTAAEASASWWEQNGFNGRTDKALSQVQFDRISRKVNGGDEKLAERWDLYQRLLNVLPN